MTMLGNQWAALTFKHLREKSKSYTQSPFSQTDVAQVVG